MRRGMNVEDAVMTAAATAGRAVLFAGITVCIALLGMLTVGVSVLSGAAIAASITVLFSLIVTFANYDVVRVLTAGGPRDTTHVFATWAFLLGIQSGDIPLGASVSLFMLPILAISAVFILRGVRRRGREI